MKKEEKERPFEDGQEEEFTFLDESGENGTDPEDFEADISEDELDLEENISLNPKKIALFCGIFVLAVLICIPLWMLTHAYFEKNGNEGTEDVIEETLAEGSADSAGQDGETPEASGEASDIPTEPQDGSFESTGTPEASESSAESPVQEKLPLETESAFGAAQESSRPAEGQSSAQAPTEPVSGDQSMSFTETADSVTAKDVTNLRSAPSTEDAENVVGQLKNGETLKRTGRNDSTGWSKLDYNGQTVYAVTQFLTTDLSYKTPAAPSNPNRVSTLDGRVIIFTDCDDYVTPKEYVNLRTEPSTSEGDTTVRCQVNNGEAMHRTGYSADSGWSRVEYNGEVLYVVSSLTAGVSAE